MFRARLNWRVILPVPEFRKVERFSPSLFCALALAGHARRSSNLRACVREPAIVLRVRVAPARTSFCA